MKGTRPTGSRWWNHATQLKSNTYDAWEEIFVWGSIVWMQIMTCSLMHVDLLTNECAPKGIRLASVGG